VRANGAVPTGGAAITPGFALPARFVIHAVGPVWAGGAADEADLLASAYRASIELADEHGLTAVAFPSISTGIFGFPVDLAAPVALHVVAGALESATHVREAIFVLFDTATLAAFERAAAEVDLR
jgi:O-acetyl-ADP-ribose deacetylase (regulator of RNase III)